MNSSDASKIFSDVVHSANTHILPYLAALVGLSTITMALIQATKTLFPIRYFFQSWFFRRWLRRHSGVALSRSLLISNQVNKEAPHYIVRLFAGSRRAFSRYSHLLRENFHRRTESGEVDNLKDIDKRLPELTVNELARAAESEIILLAADANAVALFDSEGDEFCKRLNAVAQMVVDFPCQYRGLLAILACYVDKDDFEILQVGQHYKSSYVVTQPKQTEKFQETADRGETSPQEWLNAKTRVRQQVTQAMSAFQLRNAWAWGTTMKISAFVVSATLTVLAQNLVCNGAECSQLWTPKVFATALLAAFLAPVARDLVAAIEKLRE